MAKNRSPDASVLESIENPVTYRSSSPATSRPFIAAAMVPAASGIGARVNSSAPSMLLPASALSAPSAAQRRPRHFAVVERQHPIANLLILLVALAGDQHHV